MLSIIQGQRRQRRKQTVRLVNIIVRKRLWLWPCFDYQWPSNGWPKDMAMEDICCGKCGFEYWRHSIDDISIQSSEIDAVQSGRERLGE